MQSFILQLSFIICVFVNFISCEVFDSANIWRVSPDEINITDYTESFKLRISSGVRPFKKSDYFTVYFGSPNDLWRSKKIYPFSYSKKSFGRELGNDRLSLSVHDTDNKKYIVLTMHFNFALGKTLAVKFGDEDHVIFVDTVDLLDNPSIPKITIVQGDIMEMTEAKELKVQCSAKKLGTPPQTLEIEIPGVFEETSDNSNPNAVTKTYYLTAEDDGKVIKCHLGKNTVIYKNRINIFYGPQEPVIMNPLGETDVLFPGEYLECQSDAKPPAQYYWLPGSNKAATDAPVIPQGNKLLIMDDREGKRKTEAYQYVCVAVNQIPGSPENLTNSQSVTFMIASRDMIKSIDAKFSPASMWNSTFLTFTLVFSLLVIVLATFIFVVGWQSSEGYSKSFTYFSNMANFKLGLAYFKDSVLSIYAKAKRKWVATS